MVTQFFVGFAVAQTKDISGTVTNEKNEGITGASVKVKSNTQSTFTDDNGTVSLDARHFREGLPGAGNIGG